MDDITFCLSDCQRTDCYRHPSNIQDRTIPHSYADFKRTETCPEFAKDINAPINDSISRQEGIKAIWITSDLPNTRFIGMAEYEECEWLFDDYMDAYVDVTLTACMPNQNRGGNRNE